MSSEDEGKEAEVVDVTPDGVEKADAAPEENAADVVARKLEEKKVDKELFDSTQSAISEDLKKGEKKFNQIFDIMREHGETLARIDERTLSLARKNGVE